jgi:hypothetical protein
MKKTLAVAIGALMLLACFGYRNPEPLSAQGPGGDALKTKADKLREALLNGTTQELFNKLPSWLRGRGELFTERLPQMVDEEVAKAPEDTRDDFRKQLKEGIARRVHSRDPGDTLGVKTYEDVLKLKAADLYALDIGQLRLQANDKLKPNREAKWHEVDRAVYEAEAKVAWTNGPKHGTRTYGAISFMNRFNDAMEVTCVAEGDTWQVIAFSAKVGKRNLKLDGSELMKDPMIPLIEKEVLDAQRSEGEQLLGSARDYSRVQYSKTGVPPKKLTDSTKLDYFEGIYFKVRDKVYKKPDALRGALVAEPIDEESELGWGVIYFNYKSGSSDIKWYDTEHALNKALKAFQTAK